MKKIIIKFNILILMFMMCGCDNNEKTLYKVTFMSGNTLVAVSNFDNVDYKISYIPSVPEKDGYEGKWENYTLSANDIIINAIYTPIEYTATFVANNQTVGTTKFTVETKSLNNIPNVPEKDGYEGKWENYILSTNDIIINAIYTPIEYTATFVANNQTVGTTNFTVESTSLFYIPDAPEINGYDFIDWNWNETSASKFNCDYADDIIFVGIYKLHEYSITVTTYIDGVFSGYNEYTYTFDMEEFYFDSLYNPLLEEHSKGYSHYWKTKDGATFLTNKVWPDCQKDLDIILQIWTETYGIYAYYDYKSSDDKGYRTHLKSYSVNDLSVSSVLDLSTITSGSGVRTWALDGTDEIVESVDLSALTDIYLRPFEFYTYSITYEYNGGEINFGFDVTYTCTRQTNFTKIIYPSLKKEGFTFAGWYLDEKLSLKVNSNFIALQDVTLYAKWV